jgi:hypothetical protein
VTIPGLRFALLLSGQFQRIAPMPHPDNRRYEVQRERISKLVAGRMRLTVTFEQRDGPYWISFKVSETLATIGAVRVTASVEDLKFMTDEQIVATIRAKMRRP